MRGRENSKLRVDVGSGVGYAHRHQGVEFKWWTEAETVYCESVIAKRKDSTCMVFFSFFLHRGCLIDFFFGFASSTKQLVRSTTSLRL